MSIQRVSVTFTLVAVVFGAQWAPAQGYPNKPIRMLTVEVGAGADIIARLIAQGLTNSMGQQVIVDNRGGGYGPGPILANAPPDGYTLLFSGSLLWLKPLMQNSVPYDTMRDFAPITLTTKQPNVLVVNPALPVRSVKELIALAKSNPGKLNYGSGPNGSATHLAPELFKAMADVNIVRIPYKGAGPALNALIAGEIQMMIATVGSAMPHVKTGRLLALASTSAQPSALLPGLPTISAAGLPGYEASVFHAAFARAKTPAPVIRRLNEEIVRVLNVPETKEKLLTEGVEVVGSSPEALAATIKSDIEIWGKVIKNAGIHAE